MAALAALLDEAPSLQASNQQEMGKLEAENHRLREETATLKARSQDASLPDVLSHKTNVSFSSQVLALYIILNVLNAN
jgi:hypothetical protein